MRSMRPPARKSGPTTRTSTAAGRAMPAVMPSTADSRRSTGSCTSVRLDGWLHAIDARTGQLMWKVDTLVGRDERTPYTITGAPQLAGDLIVIGNGGADFAARAAMSLRTTARAGRCAGAFTPCRAIRPKARRISRISRRRSRPGIPSIPGPPAAAARSGTAWPTTRRSSSSTSAPRTRRPTTCISAAAAAAMSSTPPRSSPFMPATARWPGITRPRRRSVGFRQHPEARAGGRRSRRAAPARAHAGREERLLLRARPANGELLSAHNFAYRELDPRHRSEDRAADRRSARRLRSRTRAGVSLGGRRAQLAAHGLRPRAG